jgi:organic hydroperoxide reductase OsmC/OhrA
MYKYVLARGPLDESIALGGIEPLHHTFFFHYRSPKSHSISRQANFALTLAETTTDKLPEQYRKFHPAQASCTLRRRERVAARYPVRKGRRMPEANLQITHEFTIAVDQLENYEFQVTFDKEHYAPLRLDEPAPLGKDVAPNAARILGAAIGNCLSASLLFCTRKARVEIGPIHTTVRIRIGRNERGRLRIADVAVTIHPRIPENEREKAARCLELFEDFCIVTQSVRDGIPVKVQVENASGE